MKKLLEKVKTKLNFDDDQIKVLIELIKEVNRDEYSSDEESENTFTSEQTTIIKQYQYFIRLVEESFDHAIKLELIVKNEEEKIEKHEYDKLTAYYKKIELLLPNLLDNFTKLPSNEFVENMKTQVNDQSNRIETIEKIIPSLVDHISEEKKVFHYYSSDSYDSD